MPPRRVASMVSSIFFTDEINVDMIVSVSWYEKWSQKRTSSMELQTIRTRLSFLLHYNRCIKFENCEIFGNGKLTFHCQFFSLQLNCWSCWCLRYQSLFPSRSNWNGNFQNWVIIPKIQPKKGEKIWHKYGSRWRWNRNSKTGSLIFQVLPPLVEMAKIFSLKT